VRGRRSGVGVAEIGCVFGEEFGEGFGELVFEIVGGVGRGAVAVPFFVCEVYAPSKILIRKLFRPIAPIATHRNPRGIILLLLLLPITILPVPRDPRGFLSIPQMNQTKHARRTVIVRVGKLRRRSRRSDEYLGSF